MPELPDQMRAISERTRATRERAQQAARALLEQAGLDQVADSATERVGKMLEDVLAASRSNRRLIERLVADEFEKVADRLGFARQSEVDELRREIEVLRRAAQPPAAPSAEAPAKKAAKKAPVAASGYAAQKSPAKKSSAKKSPAKKAAPKKNAPKKNAATKSATTKNAATKSATTKNGATKSAPRSARPVAGDPAAGGVQP